MWFIKLIFVLLIVVPVALVMFVIFRKLTGEDNEAIKKEKYITMTLILFIKDVVIITFMKKKKTNFINT